MKPSDKAIKKAKESVLKKAELERDQRDFHMCLDERVCPKCTCLLDIKSLSDYGHNYKCSMCDFTHYRQLRMPTGG